MELGEAEHSRVGEAGAAMASVADLLEEDEEEADLANGFPGVPPLSGEQSGLEAADLAGEGDQRGQKSRRRDSLAGVNRRKGQNPAVRTVRFFVVNHWRNFRGKFHKGDNRSEH